MGHVPAHPERDEEDPAAGVSSRHASTGKTIAELAIGMTASLTKAYSHRDILTFAAVTGDRNPAHLDEVFARESIFKERVVHGFLTASLISAVLGTILPGPGTVYLSQDLRFRRPVRIGDAITATVEVTELNVEKNRASLKTTCTNQRDEVVLEGKALVMAPRAG